MRGPVAPAGGASTRPEVVDGPGMMVLMAAQRISPAPLVALSDHGLRGMARALGIDPANLCRPITLDQADRWALKLGRLPYEIWGPDWWEAVAEDCEPDDEAA